MPRGGARPGAGRKPKNMKLAQAAILSGKELDAKFAFEFFASVMRDENASRKERMDAAREILDRAWGKPAQMVREAEKDEFRNYLDALGQVDAAVEQPEPEPAAAPQTVQL